MTQICLVRLKKELDKITKEKNELFEAKPLPNNLLEWHYVIKGPKNTPYENGYYHGVLKFPSDYPYKPPSIQLLTPNGRFSTNTRLCLSNSDYHPENWSPFWSVSNILLGFVSFMCENSDHNNGIGAIHTNDETKKRHAYESLQYNLNNALFKQLFPHYEAIHQQQKQQQREKLLALETSSVCGGKTLQELKGLSDYEIQQRIEKRQNKQQTNLSPLPISRCNFLWDMLNSRFFNRNHNIQGRLKDPWWDIVIIAIIAMFVVYLLKLIM